MYACTDALTQFITTSKKKKQQIACRGLSGCVFLLFFFFFSYPRQEVLSKMDVVIKEIDDLMTSQLNPELQDWKRRQQIAAIGGPLLTSLDQLQSW